jgi:hypothetical protein
MNQILCGHENGILTVNMVMNDVRIIVFSNYLVYHMQIVYMEDGGIKICGN